MQQVDQCHLGSLQRHWKRHRAFPSMAKLAEVMGLASSGSVFQAVGRLVEGGYLERVEGRIAPTRRFFSRPLLGHVTQRPSARTTAAPSKRPVGVLAWSAPCR